MKHLLQKKTLFKILFWLWGFTIFVLSSLPNIPTQKINIWDEPFRLDYLEHFGVFAIWGTSFIIWKSSTIGVFMFKKYWGAIISIILFACADEIHQIWIPGRTFNPLDLIYNVLGLCASFVLVPYFLKQVYKK